MSSLSVCNMEGKPVGQIDVPASLRDTTRGGQVVRDAIVAYRANQRHGNASTKTKGEVAGHGQKPWRQKGTGNARAGYRQSPIWRGGGVVFGPKPRSYAKDLNKKMMRLALGKIIADRVSENAITVVDAIRLSDAKTKNFKQWLGKLSFERGLIITDEVSNELLLASRNIPGIEVVSAKLVNVYQIARSPKVLITQAAFAVLDQRVGSSKEAA